MNAMDVVKVFVFLKTFSGLLLLSGAIVIVLKTVLMKQVNSGNVLVLEL